MSQNTKIPNSKFLFSGTEISIWGRWGVGGNQFPKVNFKFSKSSPELKFTFSEWVGLVETNFQKLTSNFLSLVLKFPFGGWGGGVGGNQFPTFDAESKFSGRGGSRAGGNQFPKVNFKFSK